MREYTDVHSWPMHCIHSHLQVYFLSTILLKPLLHHGSCCLTRKPVTDEEFKSDVRYACETKNVIHIAFRYELRSDTFLGKQHNACVAKMICLMSFSHQRPARRRETAFSVRSRSWWRRSYKLRVYGKVYTKTEESNCPNSLKHLPEAVERTAHFFNTQTSIQTVQVRLV